MRRWIFRAIVPVLFSLLMPLAVRAEGQLALSDYFPPPESKANPSYGAQWWVYPRHKDAPKDLVQTAGARNNHGYAVPSLDLVFVRLGNGEKFPDNDFDQQLVRKVLAAVSSPGEK